MKSLSWVSLEFSILQDEHPQLPPSVLVGEVFHPLELFGGPPLDMLQHLHVSFVVRTPHLDTMLQVRPHQRRAERQDYIPQTADHDIL